MTAQPKLIQLHASEEQSMTSNSTLERELRAYSAMIRKNFPVVMLSSDLRIIYCNALFETAVHEEPTHILGKEIRLFLDYNSVEALRTFIDEGSTEFKSQGKLQSQGRTIPIQVLCRSLNDDSSPTKYLLVFNTNSDQSPADNNSELHRVKELHKRSGQIYRELFQDDVELKSIYKDCFVINQPQDQIGGDFYRIEMHDGILKVLIGDSAGHSIASSFVSMITYTLFRHLARDENYTQEDFLKVLNEQLCNLNRKPRRLYDASTECMVLCYDTVNRSITYTSAGIRGFIVRRNDTIELNFSKNRLGHIDSLPHFSSETIKVQQGDRVFLFTDGLSDQFGGQGNKRFSRRLTGAMLNKTSIFPIDVQKDIIQQLISSWKGSNEQTDDILLISFIVQ